MYKRNHTVLELIALFTVSSAHLHYNKIWHVCEAISGYFAVLARNCLASTLDYIVMQMRKTNREKGYCMSELFKKLKLHEPLFSAECTMGMVWGLTPLKHYVTKAICC